jgi:hypothetical protein
MQGDFSQDPMAVSQPTNYGELEGLRALSCFLAFYPMGFLDRTQSSRLPSFQTCS